MTAETADVAQVACDKCGTSYKQIVMGNPFGAAPARFGECPACSANGARLREREGRKRLVRHRLSQCGCKPPEVWPAVSGVIEELLDIHAPGLLLVVGGIEDGKTTVAKAWVTRRIAQNNQQAVYARVPHLLRLPLHEVGAEIERLGAADCLALDDLASGDTAYKSWETDRIIELLSLRKGRQTLITTPCALRGAIGPLLQHRAGQSLTARILKSLATGHGGRRRVYNLGACHE